MKKKIINILKYIFFLALGVGIFWWAYRDTPTKVILDSFRNVNYFWIVMSLLFSMLSLVSRALRWQLLIKSAGHKTRFINVFLSCHILYFVNLLIPRAGEVARCTVVSSTEKVPFAKLVGTMVVERMADFLMLILIAVVVVPVFFLDFANIFSSNDELSSNFSKFLSVRNIIILVAIGIGGLATFVFFVKWVKRSQNKLALKIKSIWKTIREGVYSILQMKNKWAFIAHTFFIFLMWLAMLYVVFLAFEPTSKLSIGAGIVTFFMGGLAMLAPINGGIGAWHTMVIISLVGAYHIIEADAKAFAFIAHTTTNLVYLVFGLIALALIFIINSGKVQLSRKQEPDAGGVAEN